MNVDGSVVGRVLASVPRIGSSPTRSPTVGVGPAPPGAVAEVGLEHLADVHPARHAERVEDDVDGRAVGEERHVLDREDLGDHALVAVAAGELVADGDLALLGDVDAHQLVDAGRQLVAVVAVEHLDVDDLAVLTVGHLQRRVADLAGLLAEDRPQQALLGSQLGLALRGDLADEDVAGPDLGADADDAAVVEVGEDVVGEVRDVPADLLRAELGVAGVDLVLVDVDRRQHVVAHEALGEDDGVLEVVALPRHQGDEQVLAECQLTVVGGRPVGDDRALAHLLALDDAGPLVDARVLVRPAELAQAVDLLAEGLVLHGDGVAVDLEDLALLRRLQQVAGVAGGAILDAGADVRRLGSAPAARPASACWRPSGRGWRRRARGTGSAPCRPRRSASGLTSM